MLLDRFYTLLSILLWVSVLIMLLLWLRQRLPVISARFFRGCWIVLALRCVLPFQAPVLAALPGLPFAAASMPLVTAGTPNPAAGILPQQAAAQVSGAPAAAVAGQALHTGINLGHLWQLAVFVWAGVAAALFFGRVFFWLLFSRKLTAQRQPVLQPSITAQVKAAFGRQLPVYTTPLLASPALAGLWRPALYFSLNTPLSENLDLILAHEATHYRHRDLACKWLFWAACSICWFNPLVWLMYKAALQDLEIACDERVLDGQPLYRRQAYGMTLLQTVAANGQANGFLTGFSGGAKPLKKRISAVLDQRPRHRMRPLLAVLAILVLLAGSLVACSWDHKKTPNESSQLLSSSSDQSNDSLPAASQAAAKPSSEADPSSPSASQPQSADAELESETAASSPALLPANDSAGESLYLQFPLLEEDFTRISRTFGEDHPGIDLVAAVGSPIYSACDGVVSQTNYGSTGYGIWCQVDHADGSQALYTHCSSLVVEEGDEVRAGQLIGYVGSTGNSTGPHLCLILLQDGQAVDPTSYADEAFLQQLAQEYQKS